jgi:hypothetical protein
VDLPGVPIPAALVRQGRQNYPKHREGILAALRLGINNARAEGLSSVVRPIFRRARGFHSPEAALALVMLTCGPVPLQLPHERLDIRTG